MNWQISQWCDTEQRGHLAIKSARECIAKGGSLLEAVTLVVNDSPFTFTVKPVDVVDQFAYLTET
ncbi:TPA: hypothetical protein QDZ84_003441 [Shewanella algae]|uniref:hypothetical protein n=1 Tax=Shewanella TaxID=22 RepID=UPI00142F4951|nr:MULTISPECIES: hypothetical protein [Shewanella]NJI86987.1 hypothetical protein [Shewanella sp. Iso12]HDS1208402.1 hypothetical protein [Shewanella algae]